MNEIELARLAAMGNALRPDWPAQSLKTFLHAFAVNAYRDVAVALAWVAADPESQTPKRLSEAGPWWQATKLPGAPTFVPPMQSPLDYPDADPDDPVAYALALREKRFTRRNG